MGSSLLKLILEADDDIKRQANELADKIRKQFEKSGSLDTASLTKLVELVHKSIAK